MKTAVIVVDGVLRKTVGGALINEGRRLYVSLANTGRIILLSPAETDQARAEVDDWLTINGCVQHDVVMWSATNGGVVTLVNMLRRQGYEVDLVVVPDPTDAHVLLAAGLNTLLFTHAQYAQPSWRPDADKGVQPWYDIQQQVADQARMKAKDARLADA